MTSKTRLLTTACVLMTLAVSLGDAQSSTKKFQSPPPLYTISGQITGMTPGHFVHVYATVGNEKRETGMTRDGRYTFDAVPPGVCDVRPWNPLFTFTPSSRTVSVTNRNIVGIDFTAHEKPKK